MLLALVLSSVSIVHADDAKCEIVIGSCHRAPLSNSGSGIIDRLVIDAFKRIGHRACIEPLPCERSLRNADAGVTDGDLLRIPDAVLPKAVNLVAVPEVMYALPMSGFAARADLVVRGLPDLARLRVGYVLGWKILEDQVQAAEVLRVRGPEELFALLADGKADIVIYERNTGLGLIRAMKMEQVRVIDPPLLVTPQFLVLHRRHQTLLEPLANALRAMKVEGVYAAAFRDAGFALPEAK